MTNNGDNQNQRGVSPPTSRVDEIDSIVGFYIQILHRPMLLSWLNAQAVPGWLVGIVKGEWRQKHGKRQRAQRPVNPTL
jgi:hypothetical protein